MALNSTMPVTGFCPRDCHGLTYKIANGFPILYNIGVEPGTCSESILVDGEEDTDEKMLVVAILAAVAALGSPGQENVVNAQVICTGHARQLGTGVVGTLGADLIDCSASTVGVNIIGLSGDDFLIGGQGKDCIDAGDGNDWIFSREGDDILIGGDGKDGLFAGPGNDWLRGGDQSDTLFGDDGDDMLFGGKGDDPLFGANGNDLCNGQEGKGDWASFTCELTVHVP